MKRARVTFLSEGFGPYRVPFWNELASRCDLTVILFGKVERGRAWRVQLDSIKCKVISLDSPQVFIARIDWALYFAWGSVVDALDESNPDVVIVGGWASPGYWAGRRWALKRGKRLLLWSESHALSTRTRGVALLNAIKRWFLRPFSGFYAFSPLSVEYLKSFGVSPERIVESYNLPDIGTFSTCERSRRSEFPTLLYVGQLIRRKGIAYLLDELKQVADLSWRLDIAGDGPLRRELAVSAREGGLADRIRFLGFVQPDGLGDIYRAADILVMPSFNEVWGLVLHEALLSGVFVIGSDRAAASHALIREGENGYMISPNEPGAFAGAIRKALEKMPFDRRGLRLSVEHISTKQEVDKLVHLIDAIRTVAPSR